MKTLNLKVAAITLFGMFTSLSYATSPEVSESKVSTAKTAKAALSTDLPSDDKPTSGVSSPAETKTQVSLYPNPASTQVVLKIDNLSAASSYQVTIYDVLGKKVQENPIRTEETILSLSTLSPGLYFYSVSQENRQQATGKFLIRN